MNKAHAVLILICASIPCVAGQAELVGKVKDQYFVRGCSWSASTALTGVSVIFLAERDESKIIMNIDGTDVSLQVLERRGKLQAVGDVLERTYGAPGIQVKARYKVTSDCSQSTSEACEVTGFDAIFEVTKNGRTQTIQAIGESGC